NGLALLRLLPMSDRDKVAEILVRRHQIAMLQRHVHGERIRFTAADRALLAALLHHCFTGCPPGAAPAAAADTARDRVALGTGSLSTDQTRRRLGQGLSRTSGHCHLTRC